MISSCSHDVIISPSTHILPILATCFPNMSHLFFRGTPSYFLFYTKMWAHIKGTLLAPSPPYLTPCGWPLATRWRLFGSSVSKMGQWPQGPLLIGRLNRQPQPLWLFLNRPTTPIQLPASFSEKKAVLFFLSPSTLSGGIKKGLSLPLSSDLTQIPSRPDQTSQGKPCALHTGLCTHTLVLCSPYLSSQLIS